MTSQKTRVKIKTYSITLGGFTRAVVFVLLVLLLGTIASFTIKVLFIVAAILVFFKESFTIYNKK